MNSDVLELPILSQRRIGREGKLLSLEKARSFVPGQVIGLSLAVDGPVRWYSLASGPAGATWDVLYTKQEQGLLTPTLWESGEGAALFVKPPRGGFTLGGHGECWFVANGTGIAPFVSMLLDLEEKDPARISRLVLVHGARTAEETYFRDFFSSLVVSHALTYVLCLSGSKGVADEPSAASLKRGGELVFPGRLSVWLENHLSQEDLPPRVPVMLCGSSGMVNDVRDLLTAKGHQYDSILGEIYF